jgi:hypothetical protein
MVNSIQQLSLSNLSDSHASTVAHERGTIKMYEIGAAKAWQGETTIDEALPLGWDQNSCGDVSAAYEAMELRCKSRGAG